MRTKKKAFRGKHYYILLISFTALLLLLLFANYAICSLSLSQASRQTQTVREAMLTLQLENMDESYTDSVNEENIYDLVNNETLLALSLEEEIEEEEALNEARALLTVCLVISCVVGVGLTALIVRRVYRPFGTLVSRVTEGKGGETERFQDEYQLINQQLDAFDRQLQEQKKILQAQIEQMAETIREPLPKNQDFYELTESIRFMDRTQISARLTQILNQIEALPENGTELKDLLFSLLVHSAALTVLEIDWPGDISRQTVRFHAENVHSAVDPKALETALFEICDAFSTWQNPKNEVFLRFQEIRKYLSENYSNPNLTAKMVADRFQVCQSALTRMFKRYNQTGFLEYVHQLRLEEATRLLKETDKTRAEIAEVVGYMTVGTMDRAFKTYVGMTPGKVRKASRQQNAEEEEQE